MKNKSIINYVRGWWGEQLVKSVILVLCLECACGFMPVDQWVRTRVALDMLYGAIVLHTDEVR